MSTTDPLAGIDSRMEVISGYSGLQRVRVRVYHPVDRAQVARLLGHAQATGCRLTLRGGGHCFDSQAVGDDLVVSMAGLDKICVLRERERVRVGPGATWGAIVSELEKVGLAPAVTVTTSRATAGGTLSGDCLSRFSPAWGKEGEWIEDFDLLTLTGRAVRCTRPRSTDPADWDEPERLFTGAIGGLGYLGAVVAITYCVLPVVKTRRGVGVGTKVEKLEGHDALAGRLGPAAQQMRAEASSQFEEDKHDAIYAVLAPGGVAGRQALLFTSSFSPSAERRRLLLFRPHGVLAVPVQWLVRLKWFNRLLWRVAYRLGFSTREGYVDDLQDFTFFLDANVRAKERARPLRLKTVQQTFVVPDRPGLLERWLEHAELLLGERRLKPTLTDVLWLPQDLPFFLSATSDMSGFAVSYAFETSRRREIARVCQAFSDLSDALLREPYRGRVYLIKNVNASPATLAAMYGARAQDFLALKDSVDPKGVLRNAFFDAVLSEVPRPASTSAPQARAGDPRRSAED